MWQRAIGLWAVLAVTVWAVPVRAGWEQAGDDGEQLVRADDLIRADDPPRVVSRGQQPLVVDNEANETPSQSNNTQLNQLFQFETTPDICAAGQGYLTGGFAFTKYPGATKTYRYTLQGQYGVTDQIAVGAYIPVVTTRRVGTTTDVGDVGIYGQYKFDKFINPEIVDVTAQLDLVLPTGSRPQLRDTGHFGVRPLVLAYKDFGQRGPGTFGLYAMAGFTITTNSDFRFGVAGTYQYRNLVGVLEFFDRAGDKFGRPLVTVTPGLVYRGIKPFEIAIGVPLGVNSGTPDWGIVFKLTYAFK